MFVDLIIAFSSAITSFFVFASLFYLIGHNVINKKKRLDSITRDQKVEMYAELEQSFFDRFVSPVLKKVSNMAIRIIPKNTKSKSGSNELIRKELRYAGLSITVEEFNSIKITVSAALYFVTFIVMFLIGITSAYSMLIMMAGLILSILGPRYYIKSKIKSRKQMIQTQLPEVMDLMSVCIEAGLGFDAALIKISEMITGPLVNELLILNREIQMGCPRRQALKNFGECCDLKELKIFASSLAQAEQLGIPIKNVLNTQSNQMRVTRRQKAQEKGMKAPVKIMLPMVVFIFPVIFIILLGPTVVNLIKQFAK